jgi:hypothetical protein
MPQYPPADRNPRAPAPPTGGVGEFLEEARRVCRLRHLSIHPEESYVQTIRRFIHFHDKKHPARLGPYFAVHDSPERAVWRLV